MKPTPPGFGPSFEGATQTPTESTWPRQKSAAASGLLKDRYRFGKELGRGSIGVVYLAYDQRLHSRPVVIKVLQENPESQEWVRKKFRQEIEALSRVNHPGIVGVLDAGEMPDGKVFLVMQFVNGSSLLPVISKQGMPLERIAYIMRQVGQALSAAHEHGICHRDLKPANIMLENTGPGTEQAKIIDFGIAAVRNSEVTSNWETATIAGSLPYMAPEQLEGQPSAASDIYALGVIAYEMVTGRLPFLPKSMLHLCQLQQEGVRIKPIDLRPDLPETAQAVILKALSFDQAERQSEAREFGDELARALADNNKPRPDPPPTLEIAHVLFMDLVGYSTLTIDQQTSLLQQLQDIVRDTPEFQRAQAANRLIRLPTGDGMALAFFQDPIASVQCALNIARELKGRPDVKLRMGIHSGLVSRIADINANKNIAGGGINIAQRVMDCGDAGHILLSGTVAESARQFGEYADRLRDLGEHKVKHGVRIHLFNLFTGQLGNPETPAKLKSNKRWLSAVSFVAVLSLLAAVAVYVYQARYSSDGGNINFPPESPIASSEKRPPYIEALSYNLQRKDGTQFTSNEPLSPRQEFYLNFRSSTAGYLYIVIPGENGLPQAALTSQPPKESGLASNRIETGGVFQYPKNKVAGFWLDEKTFSNTFTVIFSPTPLDQPQFLSKAGVPELNSADWGEFLVLRKKLESRQVKTETRGNETVLLLPANVDTNDPLLFDITVRRK